MEIRPVLVLINKFIPFAFKQYCLLDSTYGVNDHGSLYMYVSNVNKRQERIKYKLIDLVQDEIMLKKLDRESVSMVFTVYGLMLGCRESGPYRVIEIDTERRILKMMYEKEDILEEWDEDEFYSRVYQVEKGSIFRAVYFFSKRDFGDTI